MFHGRTVVLSGFLLGATLLLAGCPGYPLPQSTLAPTGQPTISYYAGELITLTAVSPGSEVRYTTDGTDPGPSSALYTEPFTSTGDLALKAYATLPSSRFETWLASPVADLSLKVLPDNVGRWKASLTGLISAAKRTAMSTLLRAEYKRVFDTGVDPGTPYVEGAETQGTVLVGWSGWYAQFYTGGDSVLGAATTTSTFKTGATNLAVAVVADEKATRAFLLTGKYLSLWETIGPGATGLPTSSVNAETGELTFEKGSFLRTTPADANSALEWMPLTIGVWDTFYDNELTSNQVDWMNAGVAKIDTATRATIAQKFKDAHAALKAGTYQTGMAAFNPGRPAASNAGGLLHPWANAIEQTFVGGDSDAMVGSAYPKTRIMGDQAAWGPYPNVTFMFYVAPEIDAAAGTYDWANGQILLVKGGYAEEWARVMHHGGGAPGRPLENSDANQSGVQTFAGGTVGYDGGQLKYVWGAN